MRRLLIAINDLIPLHIARIEQAVDGWAICQRVEQAADELDYREQLAAAEIVFGRPQPAWLFDASVALVQIASVGWEQYAVPQLREKPGFALCNAGDTLSIPVAEHFLAMMFALARRLPEHLCDQADCYWERCPRYFEVTGATLCIVGFGSIGQRIAEQCHRLGMRVIAVTRNPHEKPTSHLAACVGLDQLDDVLPEADHVVACIPSTPATRGLFDGGRFAQLKPDAFFYNVGRGDLVDEDALISALQKRQLAGAGLDVFQTEPLPASSPLWSFSNVIVTPHVAGRSVREFDRMTDLFLDNLARYRAGRPLASAVISNLIPGTVAR